jgi:riboflavin transporter FmnP
VILASLNLSSAFEMVDINLLLKRLIIIGLLEEIIHFIEVCLKEKSFKKRIDGTNSVLLDLLLGTVQGSILGPVLYTFFVSPLFDIEPLLSYDDNTFIPRENRSSTTLIKDMEKSLEAIRKWRRDSGLKVNYGKTEIGIFYE